MSKLKAILANLALLGCSLLILILLFEFAMFRFILVASDIPQNDFSSNVIKFVPNQSGVFRVQDEISASFRINAQGWNSRHTNYAVARQVGKKRIAIVGDSYVAALQVDADSSFAENLERFSGVEELEVFRFGLPGAPLSYYLHMLRQEVAIYQPDLVIVNMVHNDFRESYEFKPGTYTSSFLKLKVEDEQVVEETAPKSHKSPWYEPLRRSATWRYLSHRKQIRFGALRGLLMGQNQSSGQTFQANIRSDDLTRHHQTIENVASYCFSQILEQCERIEAALLLVIDGDRNSIYSGADENELYESGALSINRIVAELADSLNIPLIDLDRVFRQDYLANKRRFNTDVDGHWNSYGHKVVADTLHRFVKQNLLIK